MNLDPAVTARNINSRFKLFSYSYFYKLIYLACCERYLKPKISKIQLTELSTVSIIDSLSYQSLLRKHDYLHVLAIPKMLEKCQHIRNQHRVSDVLVHS